VKARTDSLQECLDSWIGSLEESKYLLDYVNDSKLQILEREQREHHKEQMYMMVRAFYMAMVIVKDQDELITKYGYQTSVFINSLLCVELSETQVGHFFHVLLSLFSLLRERDFLSEQRVSIIAKCREKYVQTTGIDKNKHLFF